MIFEPADRNIRPGCLAMIVNSSFRPNNGKIVKVHGYLGDDDTIECCGRAYLNPENRKAWHVEAANGFVFTESGIPALHGPMDEENLMAIDPDTTMAKIFAGESFDV